MLKFYIICQKQKKCDTLENTSLTTAISPALQSEIKNAGGTENE